jgi:hypothetical protein
VEDLVVLVLGEVAVGQQGAGVFCVFFCEEAFGEEGGVGGDVVVEGFGDGLD